MKQIVISGIPIEIEKKRIKNMYLRVLPPEGRIHISAPIRMGDKEIKRFVVSKLDWIEMQQDKLQQRTTHRELKYVTGEDIYVWGRKYNLVVKDFSPHVNVCIEEDRLILSVKKDSSIEQKKRILDMCYKEALSKEIPSLIDKWERIIGVNSSGWSIRDMKTRWGTCNIRSRKICLNLQLAKKPPKCLEYVVVHELVHLLEKSHNKVFKGYMDLFLPQWRLIKKELNEAK
jgi:predicted metal-dependent hydrolase